MRLIDDGDDRLFHTATVAARLGRAEKLLTPLLADYDEYWDDPEAGFRYALALVAMIQAGGSDEQKREWYTRSMEALDDVVEGDPAHWLARYCRIRNRVLIRTGYGRFQEYLNDELGKVTDDLGELLERQEHHQPWQPYFAAGLLLAAQFHAGQGVPDRAAALVADAVARDAAPVPWRSLGTVLSEPMLVLFHGSPPPVRAQVGTVMTRLFPGSPAVRATARATVS